MTQRPRANGAEADASMSDAPDARQADEMVRHSSYLVAYWAGGTADREI